MAPPPPPALALLLLLLAGQVPKPGSPRAVPPDSDPGVQAVVSFALQVFNARSEYDNYFIPSRVSMHIEVTKIKMYYLKMEMVKTQCRKEKGKKLDRVNLQKCEFAPEAEMEKEICNFIIRSRLGCTDTRMRNMRCERS